MKVPCLLLCLLLASAVSQVAFADILLQDYELNINGTTYCPLASGCPVDITGVPGLAIGGFDTTSGMGTITYTTTSSGYFDLWLYDIVGIPDYNQYGFQSGTAQNDANGVQSWQIDVPDYETSANHTGTILSNTDANSLDNTNHVPGNADNYYDTCSTGTDCNDITSMAIGFNFTVPSGYQEVITLNVSQTAPPGGFYLEQIHPIDPNNTSAAYLYFTGSATQEPVGTPTVPEPSAWALFGTVAIFFAVRLRKRFAA